MCLAEALLRIPDNATRDALIRDKIAEGAWATHLGGDRSVFVNAATWGLVVTGKLVSIVDDRGLGAALTRMIARVGEPIVRRAVDLAMRLMGEQFVTGQSIAEAINRARKMESKGFTYSYDMLGEAAATLADTARYLADYEAAIHAIGHAAGARGIYAGPGISIKLSALHPRYARGQAKRVVAELLPRLKRLALLAQAYDIGFNIDAEEADRLELSLELLELLALDKDLSGWNGLGFVVQAYGKRCPFVIDWLVDLARRSGRRVMVRLVKGAYWDAEIKRTQIEGLADFPVYTRKIHTDVAFIACARKLLAARDLVFPQFATHNAQTAATIYHLAGKDFSIGDWEFQCLHGMGEPLYEQVIADASLARPCRIYAPVGTHEKLLAYLVRRLLENGANSSFVNRIGDASVPIEALIADPAEALAAMAEPGRKHDRISLPAELYPDRRNSLGLDLTDERTLASLSRSLPVSSTAAWQTKPLVAGLQIERRAVAVRNPADYRETVGTVACALPRDADYSAKIAAGAVAPWSATSVEARAAILERAADVFQARMPELVGLIVREAGKSLPNAIAEIREAIDFLRYYAAQARVTFGPEQRPLGPIVCISPWNFPLAIFTGQIAAALVAGNTVLAKPAEETPLIAAQSVRILHEAGVPTDVLQLLPGDGAIGAALVNSTAIAGVIFTGSTEVAKAIQRSLARRLSPAGGPIPLIAETGGQNAMIVDSSALTEQVVADVMASAFESAGQRCSALRILCLQDEIADRTLLMLKGAAAELSVGPTDRLLSDIGPVITAKARVVIEEHLREMRSRGFKVWQMPLPSEAEYGTFVAPAIIEIDRVADVEHEVFGPVLHVLRYRRQDLDALMDAINATGYGLTFGLHTRLDDTVALVTERVKAGNVYVNRNVVGAVVGAQPFGGRGLSGTGPKAGGPLYLGRLVEVPPTVLASAPQVELRLDEFAAWLEQEGHAEAAARARNAGDLSLLGCELELPGPVGERNVYSLHACGRILMRSVTREGLFAQMAAVLATGNLGKIEGMSVPAGLPAGVAAAFAVGQTTPISAALIEGDSGEIREFAELLADGFDQIVPLYASASALRTGYPVNALLEERCISINTAAAGGNASLMMIE